MAKPERMRSFLDNQLTPPARYGLVVLAVLLAIHFVRVFAGHVEASRESAAALATELAILSDAEVETVWAERAETAQVVADAWRSLAWTAPAPGIGAAELESAVRTRLAANGFDQLQLEVDPEPIKEGQLQFFRFNISGQLPPGRAHSLLAELAASKPSLHVTTLQFSTRQKDQFAARIEGLAPFIEESSE